MAAAPRRAAPPALHQKGTKMKKSFMRDRVGSGRLRLGDPVPRPDFGAACDEAGPAAALLTHD